jgi:Zn-dependent protease with chaperone function/Tfp pilus assembly major pilin PilA
MELVYKKEKSLFIIAAVISVIFWVALIIGTVGIALVYILLAYLAFLFAHSGFITHLKGNGVRITESQYPDLHNRLLQCCKKVGLEQVPEAYLLRTDFFNALATKFLGRHFVVLFTDVVDALENQPGAIDFYIGHEIGHIHRKHLAWNPILFPAMIFPLLGAAYRRAEEYTCDRYGVACCENDADVRAALTAIAAGDSRWKSINVDAYLGQVATTNGFWMSFNELTGDYPWLTKRLATALAVKNGEDIEHPRRHVFAWILSVFVPRFGAGGAASVLVTVALIGILAAVAIPAYQEYVQKANIAVAYEAAVTVRNQASEYIMEEEKWPGSMTDLGYSSEVTVEPAGRYEIGIYEDGVVGINVGNNTNGEIRYVVFEPTVEDGELSWICYGQNMNENLLPAVCQ